MKHPAYPKYKPSGVEWLGDVPEHWEVKRLKMAVHLTDKKVEADEENPVPYIGMENIESWTGRLLPINPDVVPMGTANAFKTGQTLFGKLRPYLAKACTPDFDGLCSTELLVLNGVEFDRDSLRYALLSDGFIKLVDSSTYGSKMPRASWDFISNCVLPIAPSTEQRSIAAFLDRETGRIDKLVAKKRELIERLKEKRTALISRTVTRGLNPNVKLKPSGIEWLGDVPEHWDTINLRHVSTRYAGGTPDRSNDSYWDEGTIPWINSGAVNQGLITQPSAFITNEAYQNSSTRWVPRLALVMALAGQGKTKGMVAQTDIQTTCNQSMAAICPSASMSARYLYWLLASQYEHIRNMAGGEARDGLNLEILGSIPCLKVPLLEQTAIAAFLDQETAKIDALVGKVESAMERLQEYRTSLITAAVTGKIDVRKELYG